MWLGCDHNNKLTGREDCSYCVHQWGVGIYYNRAENLASSHSTAQIIERKST